MSRSLTSMAISGESEEGNYVFNVSLNYKSATIPNQSDDFKLQRQFQIIVRIPSVPVAIFTG